MRKEFHLLQTCLGLILGSLLHVLLIGQLMMGTAYGQGNGTQAYTFLDLPISPRLAALGGKVNSLPGDYDHGLALFNPALGSPRMHHQVGIGATLFFADIVYNQASYFYTLPRVGTLGVGLRQVWYGDMPQTDEWGNTQGKFTAYDMGLTMSYSRLLLPGLRVGGALTPIFSKIETYNSVGLTMDVGIAYESESGRFSSTLLGRNLGGMLTRYGEQWAYAPLEIVGGVSFALAHAPLRFLITLQHLENWNYRFVRTDSYSSAVANLHPEPSTSSVWGRIFAETLAHPIVGIEITPLKYVYGQVGYNPHRAQEMGLEGVAGLEGFSWGLGVRISRFSLNFARARYHAHGASNHISVVLELGRRGVKPPEVAALFGGSESSTISIK